MRLATWWSSLTQSECRRCREALPAFARACANCGAANNGRAAAFAVAGALGGLFVAVLVAIAVVLGGHRLPAQAVKEAPGASAPERATEHSGDDFAWLEAAMEECDAEAAKDPDALHFMVTPLESADGNETPWQAKMLNVVGNAFLVNADTALEGLRSHALRILVGDYVLNVRDQAKVTFHWNAAAGPARLSTVKIDTVETFNIQILTGTKASTEEWGNDFLRKRGICYWVNAIVGH